MKPRFKAHMDDLSLHGKIEHIEAIISALVALGDHPEELDYALMGKEIAVKMLSDRLRLSLGQIQAS